MEIDCPSNEYKLESLKNYGLSVCPVDGNGNCFFQSVATNICSNPNSWSHLSILDKDKSALAFKLRNLFVQEILGSHRAMYEHFVQSVDDYVREAEKFLLDGFYNSSLGDLMPVAIATAIQATIVIFTTHQDSNPLYVVAMVSTPNAIIFLLYNPLGTGHYDAAIPCCYEAVDCNPTLMKLSNVKTNCSCGVNTTKSNISCAPNPSYATRCKCYQKGLPCSFLCKCKECENPFGSKPPKTAGQKRTQHHHAMQAEILSSKKFVIDRGEQISEAVWSSFETIVLGEICKHYEAEEVSGIHELYNDIVYYSTSEFCTQPLQDKMVFRRKTGAQISSKIKYNTTHSFF